MSMVRSILVAGMVVVLSACGGGGNGVNDPDAGVSPDAGSENTPKPSILTGLWRVESNGSGAFSVHGEMSLEFPSEAAGKARFLGKQSGTGILTCGDYLFTVVDDRVVMLESATLPRAAFVIDRVDADTLALTSDFAKLTLTRVTGDPPVEECGGATVEILATLDDVVPVSWARLSAAGNTLYFNANKVGDPVVGFSLDTNMLTTERTYSRPSGDRIVVAAESDDIFYGHCACGGSNWLSRFNLNSNTELARVDTQTLGERISINYGSFTGTEVLVGGRNDDGVHTLLRLEPTTLAVNTKVTLPRIEVDDVAWMDGTLYALVSTGLEAWSLVSLSEEGAVTRTWALPELYGLWIRGIEAAGDALYILASNPAGSTLLVKVTVH